MKRLIVKSAAMVGSVLVVSAVTASAASAVPSLWGGNGHYYEFIDTPQTWNDANTSASGSSFMGLNGHLVTITSQAEQSFLDTYIGGLSVTPAPPAYWIGASDAAAEGVWQWVTGPESGSVFYDVSLAAPGVGYSNWGGGEPNNDMAGEDYVYALAASIGDTAVWNDSGAPQFPDAMQRYVVEYSQPQAVPTPALLPGLIGFGMTILRKKKGEAQAA